MSPTLLGVIAHDNKGGSIDIRWPEITTATFAGITVAIAGNVLISLALNIQKLAHKRQDAEQAARAQQLVDESEGSSTPIATTSVGGLGSREELEVVSEDDYDGDANAGRPSPSPNPWADEPERDDEHVLPTTPANYSSQPPTPRRSHTAPVAPPKPRRLSALASLFGFGKKRTPPLDERTPLIPVDIVTEAAVAEGLQGRVANGTVKGDDKTTDSAFDNEDRNEGDYLKSKLWWLGFVLMNVGELGNFISYAFAPASIVAPLGTFALMANCIFAPLMLGERFRKLDIFGIVVAVVGAVTVVLSSNASDARLGPSELVQAISQRLFVAYTIIYAIGGAMLGMFSEGKLGRQHVFVDVGLCAIFGGFTVLSTKAISTLITLEGPRTFTEWIAYPTVVVLIGTGVGQIRYLNRALMRFDGKVVIPVQFVLFNLSAIVGSAILYGDFKRTTFHQFVTFLYGCGATFLGVFIIAWAPTAVDPAEEAEGAQEEVPLDAGAVGVLGRRRHATLVLPTNVREGQPILKRRRSAAGMIGLSPARNLLLINTPPQDGMAFHGRPSSPEMPRYRADSTTSPLTTPAGSFGEGAGGSRTRRASSWFGSSEDTEARAAAKVRSLVHPPRKPKLEPRQSSSGSRGGPVA